MQNILVKDGHQFELKPFADFFARYLQVFPDAKLNQPGFYLFHPALDEGRNTFIACTPDGQVIGFAPVFPAPVAAESDPDLLHYVWMIVVADPRSPSAGPARRQLLDVALNKARQLAASFSPGRVTRVAADLMASQQPDVAFLLANGFRQFERILVMERSLTGLLPDLQLPAGLDLLTWRLETLAEQQRYLEAYRRGFPDLPKDLEALQYFLSAPFWAQGAAISAVDPQGQIVGSVLVYPFGEPAAGICDDVFVLPGWRGRAIASALVAAGLRQLAGQGLAVARLEVKASNTPAVKVYSGQGYRVVNEEVLVEWVGERQSVEPGLENIARGD